MNILNPDNNIEFHDKPNGGWYCPKCQQYIHPDMIYSHHCSTLNFSDVESLEGKGK